MARENQGLQIALVVFVMLTIILGVTTFLFYRQYDEADTKAKANLKDAADSKTLATQKDEEINRLKQLIGCPATDSMQKVDEAFKQDMDTYAGTYPEEKRVYRDVLKEVAKTLQDKSALLASTQADLQKMKDDYKIREASKDPQIKTFDDAAARAGQDLAAERAKFQSERDRLTEDEKSVENQLQKSRKDSTDALAKIQTNLQSREDQVKTMGDTLDIQKAKLADVLKETVDVPAGEISRCNQREHTVYINLGRADGLNRLINFAVYPAEAIDRTKAGKKASIEVTQVLGDHVAEAQILEDNLSDPIISGDKLYTPIWSPGEKKHFALAGIMDIYNDGKNSLDAVRNLITMNGGVIDCEVDENGQFKGEMTANTRYLVLGEKPTDKSKAELLKGYSKVLDDAEHLRVERKPLSVLLEQLGWKSHTAVVRYGLGANPNDFRAKPPEGGNRVSAGKVSELFKPRNPPAAGAATAY